MINRKKLQQVLFTIIFFNCCLTLLTTIISLSTDYWVVARPVRQLPSDSQWKISLPILKNSSFYNNISSELTKAIEETNDYFDSEESESYLPIDLAKKDCKRYSGKIRFGLFKGVWVLNYAYGCKNRITRVSSKLTLIYVVVGRCPDFPNWKQYNLTSINQIMNQRCFIPSLMDGTEIRFSFKNDNFYFAIKETC